MSFLPIPVVDGGLVIMSIIEKIKGSPINRRIQEAVTDAGIGLLGILYLRFQNLF
jgi:regulator of sigma E protease